MLAGVNIWRQLMNRHLLISGIGAATVLILGATALMAATTETSPTLFGPEKSIAFPNLEIRNWHVNDENGIYIETSGHKWYYATFFSRCNGIQFAMGIAFLPAAGGGSLDKFGKLYSRATGRCNFASLRETLTPLVKKAKTQGASSPSP
jgi:hypothetical protein